MPVLHLSCLYYKITNSNIIIDKDVFEFLKNNNLMRKAKKCHRIGSSKRNIYCSNKNSDDTYDYVKNQIDDVYVDKENFKIGRIFRFYNFQHNKENIVHICDDSISAKSSDLEKLGLSYYLTKHLLPIEVSKSDCVKFKLKDDKFFIENMCPNMKKFHEIFYSRKFS